MTNATTDRQTQLLSDLRLTETFPIKSWALPMIAAVAAYELTRHTFASTGIADLFGLAADAVVSLKVISDTEKAFKRIGVKPFDQRMKNVHQHFLGVYFNRARLLNTFAGAVPLILCMTPETSNSHGLEYLMGGLFTLIGIAHTHQNSDQLRNFVQKTSVPINLDPMNDAEDYITPPAKARRCYQKPVPPALEGG